MTRPNYDELRRLMAEATGAPWARDVAHGESAVIAGAPELVAPWGTTFANASLIAAMRNALPDLLRDAEAGRRLRERVTDAFVRLPRRCYECSGGDVRDELHEAAIEYDDATKPRTGTGVL